MGMKPALLLHSCISSRVFLHLHHLARVEYPQIHCPTTERIGM